MTTRIAFLSTLLSCALHSMAQPPCDDATITEIGHLCVDADPVTLEAANDGGVWSGEGIVDSTTGIFDPGAVGAGVYTITYTVCEVTDDVLIEVTETADATILTDGEVCIEAEPFVLEASTAGGTWSGDGIIDETTGLFDPSAADLGSNVITYTIDDVCLAQDIAVIEVFSEPFIQAIGSTQINAGEITQINASADEGELSWSPTEGLSCTDCLNPQAQPNFTTTYEVSLVDTFGCRSSSSVTIEVLDVVNTFIPDYFSPNGNDANEVLYVRGSPLFEFTMRIYNRWGQIIFVSNDQQTGWDGSIDGRPAQPGIYVYRVNGVSPGGQEVERSGQITLVR